MSNFLSRDDPREPQYDAIYVGAIRYRRVRQMLLVPTALTGAGGRVLGVFTPAELVTPAAIPTTKVHASRFTYAADIREIRERVAVTAYRKVIGVFDPDEVPVADHAGDSWRSRRHPKDPVAQLVAMTRDTLRVIEQFERRQRRLVGALGPRRARIERLLAEVLVDEGEDAP